MFPLSQHIWLSAVCMQDCVFIDVCSHSFNDVQRSEYVTHFSISSVLLFSFRDIKEADVYCSSCCSSSGLRSYIYHVITALHIYFLLMFILLDKCKVFLQFLPIV